MAGYSYAGKGGYWGTGMDLQEELYKPMERLLSPEEFGRLDNVITSAYGGYMGYLNAYAKQKRATQQGLDAYRNAQAGTYEPFDMTVAYGEPESAQRRIPAASTKGQTDSIPTTIRRDLSGRPTEVLAGGGIRRGLGGEVIPQTAKQLAGMTGIDVAQTDAERNWKYRVPIAESKTDTLTAALEDAKLQTGRTAMDRYTTSTEGQRAQRIELAKQAIVQRYQMSRDKVGDDKAKLELKNELDMKRDELKAELKLGNEQVRQDFSKEMKRAEYAQDAKVQEQHLLNAIAILNRRDAVSKTIAEENDKDRLREILEGRAFKLRLLTYNPNMPSSRKPAIEAAATQLENKAAQVGQPPVTGAKKAKDGNWYVQNSDGTWSKWVQ